MTRIKHKTFCVNRFWSISSKVLLSALLIGIGICLSRISLAAESEAPQSVAMPVAISNIRLTMSLKDLLAARKNVKGDDPLGNRKVDPKKPDAWLRESFQSPSLFDRGDYYFDIYSLVAIVLSGGRDDAKDLRRDAFVRSMLKQYGDPEKIIVVQQQISDAAVVPALIWRRNGVLILVDFRLDRTTKGPSLYEFKAFDTNSPTSKEFYVVPAIKESQNAETIAKAKALIARLGER